MSMVMDEATTIAGPPRTGLSKSRLIALAQCDRKLWLSVHKPELELVADRSRLSFETGHRVGDIARQQATTDSGGTMIDVQPHGWDEGLRRCQQALDQPGPLVLFEAPFAVCGIGVLVDIVERDADGRLTLIEVKSASSIKKKPYVADAAIQAWTMALSGHRPDRIVLRLIDSQWVYPGGGQYAGLFKDVDVTTEAGALLVEVPQWIARGRAVLAGGEPDRMPGKHCKKPYQCGFSSHCDAWAATNSPVPLPEYPVALLLRRNMASLTASEKQELKSGRFADVRDLPAEFPADERSRAIVRSFADRSPWQSDQLGALVAAIPYPRYHFDFETITFAIPRWSGTRPYQQVPFQWSCHVEHADGRIEHHEFLDISGDDPRAACAARIVDLIGHADAGAVVVYSQQFEESRLNELARDCPIYAPGLRHVIARLVDLLPMFQRHYFHPELDASWSIKRVVSALAPELRYDNLDEVQNGGDAQQAYLEALSTSDAKRRAQLRERLLAYCRRDTEAMLRLVAVGIAPAPQAASLTPGEPACQ